ncbi:MAG: glycerol-3-phosphate 1-O-acyltransferase PlsY, partial [Lachnospiraceae bacterium]|nr:glycerol-3-phosphate 1-O-acyltransferase PlsY [Candidatus Equihabitans merdae]
LGRAKGVDITKVGSGNAGTTNALRAMGKKAGAIVFICDILKCVIAILLMRLLLGHGDLAMCKTLGLLTGMGCVLGHNFPFYMHFKGGKGIACSFAVILMYNWIVALVALAAFIVILYVTEYVSLGSVVCVTFALIAMILMAIANPYALTLSQRIISIITWTVMGGMAIYRHRANIDRLIHHRENKTRLFKK